MADGMPKTPTGAYPADSGSDQGDTFEDASDITPRPPRNQSASNSRSLTERRTSSTTRKEQPAGSKENEELQSKPNGSANVGGQPDKSSSPSLVERISLTSLDEVNLKEDSKRTRTPSPAKFSNFSRPTPKPSLDSAKDTSQQASQPLPSPAPSSPDKSAAPTSTTSTAPPMMRRFNSPFSWLSRATGSDKGKSAPSPPMVSPRDRDHVDPANPDRDPNRSSQSSLKDRFKLLRLREEAGIAAVGEDFVVADPAVASAGDISTPTSPQSPSGPLPSKRRTSSTTTGPTLAGRPTINPSLAPGTAAGIAEGPRDSAVQPVDWDLWQAVVNEGPAAVARTSAEELNKAIAAGIPQAIRGVVWQVIAKSKSEELEALYPELVARGTEKEGAVNGTASNGSMTPGTGHSNKEVVGSSSSSIHSVQSASASAASEGQTSPVSQVGTPLDGSTLNSMAQKPKVGTTDRSSIQKLEKTIRKDLGARTSYSKYIMSAGLQDGLFGVCKAYALYDEGVEYAQGMNFIAMPLLFNMPEEEAFSMLVRLMHHYGLRNLFINGMPGLHLHLYQFSRLLEDLEPSLYCHLNRRGVTPDLYATQWFLTLFAYRFPLQLVLRIYDLILSEGLASAILKFGIALLGKNRATILAMRDMAQLSTFLKERVFDVYIDKAPSSASILESGFFGSVTAGAAADREVYRADELVADACRVPVSKDLLAEFAAEHAATVRAESERQAEVDALRRDNASLAARVRRLEEAAERSDREHVRAASELVRVQVANETLGEENEVLRTQVGELRKVVERQTEEVEERLREEMNEVMRRNAAVHEANRALEEEKEGMERELVKVKVQAAVAEQELEELRRRWVGVRQMMAVAEGKGEKV